MMDQLDTLLARIRADHAPASAPEQRPASPQTPPALPPADLSGMSVPDARIRFAAFHPLLQSAMRAAARNYRWGPDTWAMQVEMVADFLEREGYWIDAIRALAERYQAPPPDGSFAEVDRDTREKLHRNPPKSHGNRSRSDATPAGYTNAVP